MLVIYAIMFIAWVNLTHASSSPYPHPPNDQIHFTRTIRIIYDSNRFFVVEITRGFIFKDLYILCNLVI